MEETNHLELLFKDQVGNSKKITVRNPKLDLTAVEAQAAVNTIADTEIFSGKNGDPYAQGVGARYIKRVVEDIYIAE